MSATVLVLPTLPAVEAAWDAYSALRAAERENPAMRNDPEHQEAATRAHEHFSRLFLQLGKRECRW